MPKAKTASRVRKNHVELRKGRLRYYYVIVAPNGEVVVVSEHFYSKYNAERAAFRAAKILNVTYGKERH